MYAYTLLTEVYCQSATGVKNTVVFLDYYIRSMILFCHITPAHGLYKVFSIGGTVDNIMK